MKTNDFSYFIERYIAGEMDEAEKNWFLSELDGNENLRKEVEIRQKTDLILKNQDVIKLRNKLNMIEGERALKAREPKFPYLNKYRYAAIITAFVIIGGITLLSVRKPDNEEIMEKYNSVYEAASPLRSGEVIDNPDFSLALEYYEIHDYRNAAVYFSRSLENHPHDMQSELLNGISNFEISNYPDAKRSLVKVIDDKNNLYIDHARWYLALCYIKTDEKEKAIEQLAVIEEARSIYKKDAKKLHRSLR